MREKATNEYYQRHAQGHTRIAKRFVFVVCEGTRTEPKYLKRLCYNRGIDNLRFLEPPSSNPMRIMESLVTALNQKRIDFTLDSIAKAIADNISPNEADRMRIRSCAQKIANKKGVKVTDVIDEHSLPDFLGEFAKKLGKEIEARIAIEDIKNNHVIDTEYDAVYIVSDRDAFSYTRSQCQNVIRLCQQNNVHYALTNPCIEFFYLLHWTDCTQYSRSEIAANKKSGRRTFVHLELSKYDERYGKKNFSCDKYFQRYAVAKRNASLYATSIEELVDDVGSTFFDLVDLLLGG
ncbi:MAG: RloB domain-containing protein [Bacilli bacterium]|nr:RloB domain-containing protein [Bacilli bacterium]MBO6284713.1 RloB domain-containing protein [Bacilli bacterium]